MPVCGVCSGSDFICDSGFYFCAECQTQSQDVRQEVHDNDDADDEGRTIGGKRKRKAKSECSSNDGEVMTSWEGFNFALAGLVDELIKLGAKPELKVTILKLWTDYLRKMEVAFFSKEGPAVPKLGPNFKKYDANIIYGFSIQKKQYKKDNSKVEGTTDSQSECALSNGNNAAPRLELLKQKRQAIRQNYDKMMHEMSMASQTLTDVTLEMLAISEMDVDEGPRDLQFNAEGEEKRQLKGAFHFHPGLLVRNRLICLLYLGLQLLNEKIYLSDLLRWIAEGHISYSRLAKFFPPEAQLRGENYNLFAAHQPCPPYRTILTATQHLAAYIGLKSISVPNMSSLIKRYIKELNLPVQVGMLAERLLEVLPKLPESIPISLNITAPNWEGRAMAHIVIAVKLLFGLDDATEHRNSRLARKFNELIAAHDEHLQLFVWDDWERFSVLRLTAFSLFHKTSYFKRKLSTSMIQNAYPFISEWNKGHRTANLDSKRSAIVLDMYKHLSTKLKEEGQSLNNFMDESGSLLSFPPCLTPYSSYTQLIASSYHEVLANCTDSSQNQLLRGLNFDMLKESFLNMSVDYLTHPNEYIEWAQQRGLCVGLHSGAANNSIKVSNRDTSVKVKNKFFRVKVYLDKLQTMPSPQLPQKAEKFSSQPRMYHAHKPLILPKVVKTIKKSPLPCVTDMKVDEEEEHVMLKTVSKVKRGRGRPKIVKKSYDDLKKEDEDNMIHIPCTEYWMLHMPIHSESDFTKEAWQLPQSFVHFLEECSSLLEMQPFALYREIMYLELLHKDLSLTLPSSIDVKNTAKNTSTFDAGNANRLLWFKKSWC